MFNLEPAIAVWRQQMIASGIKSSTVLDELEGHLRDDINTLRSSGTPEVQAFETAVSRLGTPRSMRTEFNKVKRTSLDFVTIASFSWIGVAILLALLLSGRLFSGRLNFLLFSHVFSLTTGYFAALLTGSFGVYYVCCQLCLKLSPSRQESLNHAGILFTRVAAGLVTVGFVLGMLWSKQNLGRYFGAGPREIGTLCAFAWIITAVVFQRFFQMNGRATMLMCIGGNVIISLAWFGSGIIASGSRSYGIGNYWPLAVFIGIHFAFLIMGGVPIRSVRLKSS
jgi:hypothetical protein